MTRKIQKPNKNIPRVTSPQSISLAMYEGDFDSSKLDWLSWLVGEPIAAIVRMGDPDFSVWAGHPNVFLAQHDADLLAVPELVKRVVNALPRKVANDTGAAMPKKIYKWLESLVVVIHNTFMLEGKSDTQKTVTRTAELLMFAGNIRRVLRENRCGGVILTCPTELSGAYKKIANLIWKLEPNRLPLVLFQIPRG